MITPFQAVKRRGVSPRYRRFDGIYWAFYASHLANACLPGNAGAVFDDAGSRCARRRWMGLGTVLILAGSRGIIRFKSDCGDDAIGFLQHFAGEVPVDRDRCIADRGPQKIEKLIHVRFEALALGVPHPQGTCGCNHV
jgi:hypothetical protein